MWVFVDFRTFGRQENPERTPILPLFNHTLVTKLHGIIQGSIASQKAARLQTELPVRAWLRDLRASTAPAEEATQRSILVEYTNFIHRGHTEWPPGGPSTWLGKWEELLARAERFNVPIPFWLTDVS